MCVCEFVIPSGFPETLRVFCLTQQSLSLRKGLGNGFLSQDSIPFSFPSYVVLGFQSKGSWDLGFLFRVLQASRLGFPLTEKSAEYDPDQAPPWLLPGCRSCGVVKIEELPEAAAPHPKTSAARSKLRSC